MPDGQFSLAWAGGAAQAGTLEVDNGTLPLRRFRHKLRIFEAARDQGVFERQWGRWGTADFDVYVLAPSTGRLRHLRAAARKEVDEDLWDHYYFADFSILQRGEIHTGWWPIDTDDPDAACGLLLSQAFAGPARRAQSEQHNESPPSKADLKSPPDRRAA